MTFKFAVVLSYFSFFVADSLSWAGDTTGDTMPPYPARLPVHEIMSLANDPGLGFPFAPVSVIAELRSFGITPWGDPDEEHFGIDLIPYYGSSSTAARKSFHKVKVVAPTAGIIRAIWSFDSTDAPGNIDIAVILEINSFWSVILMFEPKSAPGRPVAMQVRSIKVKAGQHVDKGDMIGFLVVGEGIGEEHPHVHYALLYKDSSIYYFDVLQDIVPVPNLDAADAGIIAPAGLGSPWDPTELTLPGSSQAAFFCPYQFSSPRAKQILEHVIDNTENACGVALSPCACVCIFNNLCE